MDSNTISITENKVIVLNSKDSIKQNGEYLSQVRFKFRDIFQKSEDVLYASCSLLSCEIPVSFYNMNVNNYTLAYTINSVAYTLVVPEGNYNMTSFITALTTVFNATAHGHDIAITFNKTTGKLTITKTVGAFSIIIMSVGSSIYEVLGLLAGTNYTISATLSCPYMANLLGVKKLKIYCKNISLDNYDSSNHTSNVLHTVPVDAPSYGLLVYQNNNSISSIIKNKFINEIDVEIRDENNFLIDFNNVNWTLTILLNIYKKFIPPVSDSLSVNSLAMSVIQEPENNPIPTKTEIKEIMNKLDEDNLRELKLLLYNN